MYYGKTKFQENKEKWNNSETSFVPELVLAFKIDDMIEVMERHIVLLEKVLERLGELNKK